MGVDAAQIRLNEDVSADGRIFFRHAESFEGAADDGSWAAHVEHTIAVTPAGPWVLTALDSPEPGA